MPAANIIQLRQLLREKFPGLRGQNPAAAVSSRAVWPTGLAQLDDLLQGGLPKGALTELICAQPGAGSALLIRSLLERASNDGRLAALIDGADSFDVTQVNKHALSRLLWVRCRSAGEALKAGDLILRDGNLPFVMLDLVINSKAQLKKVPATTWYRLQRILEQTSTVCAVFTPWPMVSPAQARISLDSRFSLTALERNSDELLRELAVSAARHLRETNQNFA